VRADAVGSWGPGPTASPAPGRPKARRVSEAAQLTAAGQGWGLMSGATQVVKAASELDAKKALDLARQYSAVCYIGRNNRRENHRLFMVQYWK